MNATLLADPIEAGNRLAQLGLSKEQLCEGIDAMVGARASCTENDPPATPGFTSWSSGIRRMREVLILNGWEKCDDDQIPSVYNRELNVKLVVCNTDDGTGLIDAMPQQRSRKGPGTEKTVSANQGSLGDILTSTLNRKALKIVPFSTPSASGGAVSWYLCVYDEGDSLRAELSCPSDIENGFFRGFFERILLVGKDDNYKGVRLRQDDPLDDSGFEVNVSKKQS